MACKYCGRDIPITHKLGRRSVYCSDDCKKAFMIVDLRVRQKRFHDKRERLDSIRNSQYAIILATTSVRTGHITVFHSWLRSEFGERITQKELDKITYMLCNKEEDEK